MGSQETKELSKEQAAKGQEDRKRKVKRKVDRRGKAAAVLDEVAELPLVTNQDGLGPRRHPMRILMDSVAVRLLVRSNRK